MSVGRVHGEIFGGQPNWLSERPETRGALAPTCPARAVSKRISSLPRDYPPSQYHRILELFVAGNGSIDCGLITVAAPRLQSARASRRSGFIEMSTLKRKRIGSREEDLGYELAEQLKTGNYRTSLFIQPRWHRSHRQGKHCDEMETLVDRPENAGACSPSKPAASLVRRTNRATHRKRTKNRARVSQCPDNCVLGLRVPKALLGDFLMAEHSASPPPQFKKEAQVADRRRTND